MTPSGRGTIRDFVATDSVANGFGRSETVIRRIKPGFTLMEETNAACPVKTSSPVPALECNTHSASPTKANGRTALLLRERVFIFNYSLEEQCSKNSSLRGNLQPFPFGGATRPYTKDAQSEICVGRGLCARAICNLERVVHCGTIVQARPPCQKSASPFSGS